MNKTICVASVIDNCKLVLNIGSNDGVQLGDRFLIYDLSKDDILDPITSKPLGKLEIVKGKGRVIHVQPEICTIETIDKKEKTKKQIKDNNALYGILAWGGLNTPSTTNTEEEIITIPIPFEDPKVGDLAKQI